MKLVYTANATAELAEVGRFLRSRNPQAAIRVMDDIHAAIDLIAHFPAMGQRQTEAGVRRKVTRAYEYLIYYSVDMTAQTVMILSIRHPSQQREREQP